MVSGNAFKGFVACPICGFAVTRFGDFPVRQCDKCKTTFQDKNSQDNLEEIFSESSGYNVESLFHDNFNGMSLSPRKNGSSLSPKGTTEPGSSHGESSSLRGFVSKRTRRPSLNLNMKAEKGDTCSVYSETSASSQEQFQERSFASGSSSRNSRMLTFGCETSNDDYDDVLSEHNALWSETDTSFTGESSRSGSKYTPSVTPRSHEAAPNITQSTIPHYPRSRRTLVKDAQHLKPFLPTETGSCCLHCQAEGYHSSVEYSAPNPHCAHIHHKEEKVEKQESSERCYRPVLGGINFLFCYKCLKVLQMPLHFRFSRRKTNKLCCGACKQIISYSVINEIHIVPRDHSPGENYSTVNDARKKPQGVLHRLMGYFSARDIVYDETCDMDGSY